MIHALVRREDAFREREYCWITGRNREDCWRQVENMLADDWDYHSSYDIVEWEEFGIRRNALTNTIITTSQYS